MRFLGFACLFWIDTDLSNWVYFSGVFIRCIFFLYVALYLILLLWVLRFGVGGCLFDLLMLVLVGFLGLGDLGVVLVFLGFRVFLCRIGVDII